ncbi:MAG: AMP-binding protein [Planctomycetaceae bacterium]|nr:AMP-binding protein [Planctomycetaceae bacterium]
MPTARADLLSREEILAVQNQRLRDLLAAVLPANRFWRERYAAAGVDCTAIHSVDDLPQLPPVTKQELIEDQTSNPPYGTNLTYGRDACIRLHQTSGTTGLPLRWLDTPDSWNWLMQCWAGIYGMVGLRADDRLAFPFSFGPFIGFWAAFEGAQRLGNLCLAGGGMTSTARLQMIEENEATFVCCTPTYALRLAEVAEADSRDLAGGSVRGLVVAGEPGGLVPAVRERIETAWGARVFDHWGMTEIGSLAVEREADRGCLTVLENECIAEIVDPDTGEPVPAGEVGELLITNLGRLGSPLIRYRTGDLVQARTTEEATCSLLQLEGGILGRRDDMVTIRGNNVFPSTLEAVLRQFDELAEFRITLRTVRAMNHLRVEVEPVPELSDDQATTLAGRIAQRIRDRLNFAVDVQAVPVDSLPRFELKGRRFHREVE